MALELKEVEISDTRTIATLDSGYTIMAVGACGHTRELHTLSTWCRRQHQRRAGRSCDATSAKQSNRPLKSTGR
jgi:hypothetical protein